jgi:hypothetical protein
MTYKYVNFLQKGINAQLRYYIKSGIDSNRFSINQQTGIVSTATQLDREEKDLYNLTVVVEDMDGNTTMGRVYNNTALIYIHVQVRRCELLNIYAYLFDCTN